MAVCISALETLESCGNSSAGNVRINSGPNDLGIAKRALVSPKGRKLQYDKIAVEGVSICDCRTIYLPRITVHYLIYPFSASKTQITLERLFYKTDCFSFK